MTEKQAGLAMEKAFDNVPQKAQRCTNTQAIEALKAWTRGKLDRGETFRIISIYHTAQTIRSRHGGGWDRAIIEINGIPRKYLYYAGHWRQV